MCDIFAKFTCTVIPFGSIFSAKSRKFNNTREIWLRHFRLKIGENMVRDSGNEIINYYDVNIVSFLIKNT